MSLNDLMEFDHVVYSDGHGNVASVRLHDWQHWAPAPYVDLDADGQMISLDPNDIHDLGDWKLLNGFSGQDRYHGPIMHESEFVGGDLEIHIRYHAGYYVVVEITGIGPLETDTDGPDLVGWAVAYRESEGS